MTKTNRRHPNLTPRLAILGLLATFAVPSLGTAAVPVEGEPDMQCAMDECAESTVTLQIDTLTGDVYLIENGTLTLTDNELTVHFGGQSRVLLVLQYTVGEWEVEISSEGSPTETFETSGGALRYFIEPDHSDYVFSSTEAQQSASTMMNMAPVPPGEIIIMPDSDCPPD